MILNIFDIGILADMEGMDTVMAGFAAAFTVDTAAGYDSDVCTVFHIKIVVDNVKSRFRHDNRNVHLFVLCFAADFDIDARKICFLHNSDVPAVTVTDCHTV